MTDGKSAAAVTTAWSRLAADERERLRALPRSLAILLENILVHEPDAAPYVAVFTRWLEAGELPAEIPFRPSRILMQDTAGVAALADLAALRDHAVARGHLAEEVDAAIPVDLVIDHSVRVDHSGTADAAARNIALEYARNGERYAFFKWAEQAFAGLHVVPPGQGICHQINLERLAQGAIPVPHRPEWLAAETVIGTDSHTTMVNALGILGWGVGGMEAELAALGAPLPIAIPRICEVRLTGVRRPGVTATDMALHITARLRDADVVDQIVEFSGDALDGLTLPDRAAIANMAPEYGATAGLFPVDEETLAYLSAMGRSAASVDAFRAYARATRLWRYDGPARRYSRSLEIAVDAIEPVMAGPHQPQRVWRLSEVPASLRAHFPDARPPAERGRVGDGAIAIAAITSCTNTANPHLMVAAGLLARNAIARGLKVPSWVKTSLAPGSRHIADLLRRAGVQEALDGLGFQLVGFGCTTCVGNSGELKAELLDDGRPIGLLTSLLSGNRNFPNRIQTAVGANYLASPPLVVAGALAGNLFVDLQSDPLGHAADGAPVFLADIWPDDEEVQKALDQAKAVETATGEGRSDWSALPAPAGPQYPWDDRSAFIRRPPFFGQGAVRIAGDIIDARPLLVLGDNVTTDHISPIGRIGETSPAAAWLRDQGSAHGDLGSYGDRRANHHIMLRGTFDNARLENLLVDRIGNWTIRPDGGISPVFDAATAYCERGIPTVIFAGWRYGTGSARDWAAKGTALLGVRAVIARGFERIHRNNLIAMGVLPVVIEKGEALPVSADSRVAIRGIAGLGFDQLGLTVELHNPHTTTMVAARADIPSPSQLRMLLDGGLFAMLAKRYPQR